MGIGASIFLIALGAILAFAVDAEVSGLDVAVVGYILIGAGVLGLALFLLVFGRRDRRIAGGPVVGGVVTESVVREREVY